MKKSNWMAMVAAVLFICGLSVPAHADLVPSALLTFESDPGNTVGQGMSFDSSTITGGFNAYLLNLGDNGIHYRMDWMDEAGQYRSYALDAVVQDGYIIPPGFTFTGYRWPFNAPGEDGMAFASESLSFNTSWGVAQVYSFQYNDSGAPVSATLDWYICDTTTYGGDIPDGHRVIWGTLSYSNLPVVSATVPAPSAILTLGAGLAGLLALRKKK